METVGQLGDPLEKISKYKGKSPWETNEKKKVEKVGHQGEGGDDSG